MGKPRRSSIEPVPQDQMKFIVPGAPAPGRLRMSMVRLGRRSIIAENPLGGPSSRGIDRADSKAAIMNGACKGETT